MVEGTLVVVAVVVVVVAVVAVLVVRVADDQVEGLDEVGGVAQSRDLEGVLPKDDVAERDVGDRLLGLVGVVRAGDGDPPQYRPAG
ncbi:hypothetical protein ACFH04_41910 [Streptomyces noboritoensis]|uniref:Secreted protein n=1 Tax=Streptomyces noboritoensis TaxID=67337 RepID=A0ABV6TWS0_9ACTN